MYFNFEYADKRLSDFGFIMCHINTDAGINDVELGCDITFNTVKNSNSSIQSITSTTYDNVYTTEFEIMKNPCKDGDIYMSSSEARHLIKWLNRREYAKFKVINDISDESDVYYYGSFNVKQVQIGDKILGLNLTFTANAPYGFSGSNHLKFMLLKYNNTFEIDAESDEVGIIYPTVSIKMFYDNDITITNTVTQTSVVVKGCKANEIIMIDGENKIISTDNDMHKSTLQNDFNYEYLDILIDYDNSVNTYTVSAQCEVSISYSPIRKVGVI